MQQLHIDNQAIMQALSQQQEQLSQQQETSHQQMRRLEAMIVNIAQQRSGAVLQDEHLAEGAQDVIAEALPVALQDEHLAEVAQDVIAEALPLFGLTESPTDMAYSPADEEEIFQGRMESAPADEAYSPTDEETDVQRQQCQRFECGYELATDRVLGTEDYYDWSVLEREEIVTDEELVTDEEIVTEEELVTEEEEPVLESPGTQARVLLKPKYARSAEAKANANRERAVRTPVWQPMQPTAPTWQPMQPTAPTWQPMQPTATPSWHTAKRETLPWEEQAPAQAKRPRTTGQLPTAPWTSTASSSSGWVGPRPPVEAAPARPADGKRGRNVILDCVRKNQCHSLLRELGNVKTRRQADALDEKLSALAAQLDADDARLDKIARDEKTAREKAETHAKGKG
jgi:hypothetical protein